MTPFRHVFDTWPPRGMDHFPLLLLLSPLPPVLVHLLPPLILKILFVLYLIKLALSTCSWRSVLYKVARARSNNLLSKPHDHLTYLAYNVLALSKLRRFADASTELDSLHDYSSHLYQYETYPEVYPNRSGSMLPFLLRFLHAQIPIKLGNRQEGLDRFYSLLDFTRQRIKEKELKNLDVSVSVWRKREVFVMNCIIGHHLGAKEFNVCLDLINDLINRDHLDPTLASKLGYIQMQIGDIEGAKGSFSRIETMLNEGKNNGCLSEVELKNLVGRNKALTD